MNTCEECGAQRVNGKKCFEQLGEILLWEQNDRQLAAVHFVTVAAYNLQHPAQFEQEAIKGLRASLAAYLAGEKTVEMIRQENSNAYEGARKVLKLEAERRVTPKSWAITIADVYIPDSSEGAAKRVRAWGQSIVVY